MNTDIRLAVGFVDHPKTVKLARRLGERGVLCLLRLWAWAANHRSDGVLTGLDDEDVAIAAGWPDDPGAFVSAMLEVGFFDREGEALALHDWGEHQAWAVTAKERSERARRAAEARWRRKGAHARGNAGGNAGGNAPQAMPGARDEQSPSPVPSKETPPKTPPKDRKARRKFAVQAWNDVLDAVRRRGRYNPPQWPEPVSVALRAVGGYSKLCDARETELPRYRARFLEAMQNNGEP